MGKCRIFMTNLQKLMQHDMRSTTAFAAALGIPRTTIQSIRKRENLSLYTAIQISEGLQIPLDVLVYDKDFPEKFDLTLYLLKGTALYRNLPEEKQELVIYHIDQLLEVLMK